MITNISTLPTPPNRNDPGTFSDRADALLGAMPTLVTELNNFVSEVNTLSFKTACRAATTTNITLSGAQTIDGVSVSSGDRVLVKNQNSAAQNGIYTVSANSWTRAADMDTAAEVAGSFVPITFGATQGGKIYYTTFNATGGVLGTTAIPWNSLTEGSITGVGTLSAANGGTGLSSYSVGDLVYASAATTLTKLAAAASGNVLKSGTAPSWGKVDLTSEVSGALPAANGGTGLATSGSAGNVLTSTGSGWTSSPVSVANTSTSSAGVIQLATDAEVATGTSSNKAVTPSSLRASGLVRGTQQAATSGTSVPITGIPSWAKRIVVLFWGVSTNGSTRTLVQIGTSGGIETTGYISSASYSAGTGTQFTTDTTGFVLEPTAAASAGFSRYGRLVLENISGNNWVSSSLINGDPGAVCCAGAGGKTLSGTLTQLRVTTVGQVDTFDGSGFINIMYE